MHFLALASLLWAAHSPAASFPVKNGKMEINLNGSTGGNAGSVNLNLSYADPAKTTVKVEGAGTYGGRSFTVSEQAPLSQLKQILVYASGGDGYDGSDGRSGYDGSNGMDGSNGWDGSDGCPPGSGTNGSDGYNGTDGGDGTDGTDGGNGGSGGVVRVTAPADQSELLLLFKASVAGGDGGRGGRGGSGGNGGRGGRGGQGGRGGRNTCTNDKGELIGGPDGSNGWNGSDGRSGSDGRPGRSGSNGYDGRDGSLVYVTTDASGSHEYAKPFKLTITSVKALDDNEDTVVEPGELVHVTEITITNSGPMPTPASQALSLSFAPTGTLVPKNAPATTVGDLIPANSSRTLTFAKGQLVFQAPDKAELVGKDTLLATKIGINSFTIDSADSTGLSIHWPVGISAATDKAGAYFGSARALTYSIKNVTTKEVGPSGVQPVDVEFSWVSKEVPAADVTVVLKDGRQFTLERPFAISDFTIPAKSTLPVPLTVNVKNTKGLLSSSGVLKLTLKLKDLTGEGKDSVDNASTALTLAADFRPIAFNKAYDLRGMHIQCKFPERLLKNLDITQLELAKSANSEEVRMRISREGFLSDGTSAILKTNTFDFAPYGSLTKGASSAVVLGFLNRIFAPATAKGESTWVMQPGSCSVQH